MSAAVQTLSKGPLALQNLNESHTYPLCSLVASSRLPRRQLVHVALPRDEEDALVVIVHCRSGRRRGRGRLWSGYDVAKEIVHRLLVLPVTSGDQWCSLFVAEETRAQAVVPGLDRVRSSDFMRLCSALLPPNEDAGQPTDMTTGLDTSAHDAQASHAGLRGSTGARRARRGAGARERRR